MRGTLRIATCQQGIDTKCCTVSVVEVAEHEAGMKIVKLTGHVGAEITNCDLRKLNASTVDDLTAALFAHGVVVVRGQDLAPEDHIALAEEIGEIDVNRFFNPVPDYPKIAEVRTSPDQAKVIGGTWHSDHSYDEQPAMASILVARELPPFGGDTLFASQVAAAAHLSDGLRETLRHLNAVHSDGSFSNSILGELEDASFKGAVSHPMLIKHPQTGQEALFVNGDFTTHIDGWTEEESAPLLSYLYRYCTQPAFTCRVKWQPGSVAIWENRLVQHFATADYHGHGRLMHRITVKGQALSR